MKQQRHATIRDLLVRTTITSQDDLRRKLAARGVHVTQATLSRDVNELRLTKGPSGYAIAANASPDDDLPNIRDIFRNFALEARLALNLLVLITTTGSAQPVAAAIDYEDWPEVIGTIAGDDTVLIICASEPHAQSLKTRIEKHLT